MNKKPLDYICCEIDSPEYSRAEIKKYLYFWNKNNFWRLSFNYIQPALSANQEPVTGLWFTISPQRLQENTVSSKLVSNILYDYIKYAMCIEDPTQCDQYKQMTQELKNSANVELTKII